MTVSILCLQLAWHDITINLSKILMNLKFSDDLYHIGVYKP